MDNDLVDFAMKVPEKQIRNLEKEISKIDENKAEKESLQRV